VKTKITRSQLFSIILFIIASENIAKFSLPVTQCELFYKKDTYKNKKAKIGKAA
jgi:hypothetical protein